MMKRVSYLCVLASILAFTADSKAADSGPTGKHIPHTRKNHSPGPLPEKALTVHLRTIVEATQLRNSKLRYGDKRTNKLELEPTARLSVRAFKGRPVSLFGELEFIQKKKRESGKEATTTDTLNFNQAWLQFAPIPDVDLRLGRWLLRDEREWLFDENIDGVYAKYDGKVETEFVAGQVNYWQRDLLDSSTRGDKTNILALIPRYDLSQHWLVGGYAVYQNGRSTKEDRQLNMGLRSWASPRQAFSHWLDISTVRGQKDRQQLRGYAVDSGATLRLKEVPLQPRFTLGYAWGSGDSDSDNRVSKRYRQTGLQGNEATFGGMAKFKIYGDTLAPELTNIHIITAGTGIDLGQQASLDVVYHYYRQHRLGALVDDTTALDAKYDRKTTKKLGSALDVIVGWRPHQRVRLEGGMAWFAPSSRFHAGSSRHSPRAGNASSWWLKAEVRF